MSNSFGSLTVLFGVKLGDEWYAVGDTGNTIPETVRDIVLISSRM